MRERRREEERGECPRIVVVADTAPRPPASRYEKEEEEEDWTAVRPQPDIGPN